MSLYTGRIRPPAYHLRSPRNMFGQETEAERLARHAERYRQDYARHYAALVAEGLSPERADATARYRVPFYRG